MSCERIQTYSGSMPAETLDVYEDRTIGGGSGIDLVVAGDGGTVAGCTVSTDGTLRIFGGSVSDISVISGLMEINGGDVSRIRILSLGAAEISADVADLTVAAKNVRVNDGGRVSDFLVLGLGVLTVGVGGHAGGSTSQSRLQSGGKLELLGGSAENIAVASGGGVTVGTGAFATNIVLNDDTVSLTVRTGGTLANSKIRGAILHADGGATLANLELAAFQPAETLDPDARGRLPRMVLAPGVHFKGFVKAPDGAAVEMPLDGVAPNGDAFIDDLSVFSGMPEFTVTLASGQTDGIYALAGTAAAVPTVSVVDSDGARLGAVSDGRTLTVRNRTYALDIADGRLEFSVGDYMTQASSAGLLWAEINGAKTYEVRCCIGGLDASLTIRLQCLGLETLALPTGEWRWQVREADGGDWMDGLDFDAEEHPAGPQRLDAACNGTAELFFAHADGTWSRLFEARHVGFMDGWDGTGEQVGLVGRNRIVDVFGGSDDQSILVLTDDANGDALFVDDEFSELPDCMAQGSRIARIGEIRAGGGDDLVDLTSARHEYIGAENGIVIRGGDGDDTLWANAQSAMLFGDDGNDRLVGGSANDIIVGGAGNDSMHGGGGDDVFCFCAGWGRDTVEQLPTGGVTLWFAEDGGSWNPDTMTYTQGDDSVRLLGVSPNQVTLKCGDDGSDKYASLLRSGAFSPSTSTTIFTRLA